MLVVLVACVCTCVSVCVCGRPGEYVAVEKVENSLKQSSLVEQLWVYGNSLESTLVAVVVPNEAGLLDWAKGAGVKGDFGAVCATKDAHDHLLKLLTGVGKDAKLKARAPGHFRVWGHREAGAEVAFLNEDATGRRG
jgi:hypothetical protein